MCNANKEHFQTMPDNKYTICGLLNVASIAGTIVAHRRKVQTQSSKRALGPHAYALFKILMTVDCNIAIPATTTLFVMKSHKGGTILVHIGTNNADKEGTTAIVDKYRKLLKKTKEARVGQIILSGILPVFGNRIDGYRNSKRMAINGMVKRLCKEEDVGYVDLWDSFVGKEEMYLRDGLHLSGKGAAVFAEGLSGAVASGLGKVRYLN